MTYGSQFDNKQAIMFSDLAQNEFFNLKKKDWDKIGELPSP